MLIGQTFFRLGRILAGYFIAIIFGVFVTKVFGFADNGFNLEGYHARSFFHYHDYLGMAKNWLVLVFVMPFLLITEVISLRLWIAYVAYPAGLGLLFTIFIASWAGAMPSGSRSDFASNLIAFAIFVGVPAATGLVYWLIAGRFAGGLLRALLGNDENYGR